MSPICKMKRCKHLSRDCVKYSLKKSLQAKGYQLFWKTALETGSPRQSVISGHIWGLDKAEKLPEAHA